MLVKAQPGEKCPCEDNPRTYITDDPQGVTVPDSTYYRRLVDDGSLIPVTVSQSTDTAAERSKK